MKSLRRLLGLWWISWFGIIGGFLMVGIGEYKHESPAASHFSITLMIVTILLWIVFFIADNRARKRIDGERSTTVVRSEEHTSELQSQSNLVCRLLLGKKNPSSQHDRQ